MCNHYFNHYIICILKYTKGIKKVSRFLIVTYVFSVVYKMFYVKVKLFFEVI